MLTCVACNNAAGASPDAAVAKRERAVEVLPFLAGEPTTARVPAKAIVDGIAVNVHVESSPGRIGLIVDEHTNDPRVVDEYFEALERIGKRTAAKPEIQIQARFRYHSGEALAGDLKTAYLVAFAALGYAFAFQPEMDLVRDQIRQPQHDVIPRWWREPRVINNPTCWLGITTEPVLCAAVGLRRCTVYLPLGMAAGEFYAILARSGDGLMEKPMPGLRLPWPDTMQMRFDHAEGLWARSPRG